MFLAKQGRAPYPAGAEGNHMIADIQPIEIAGEHWVRVIVDDHELAPRGPYRQCRHSWRDGGTAGRGVSRDAYRSAYASGNAQQVMPGT